MQTRRKVTVCLPGLITDFVDVMEVVAVLDEEAAAVGNLLRDNLTSFVGVCRTTDDTKRSYLSFFLLLIR